jgi:hypothetical protein
MYALLPREWSRRCMCGSDVLCRSHREESRCKRFVDQAKLSSTTPDGGGCGESGIQAWGYASGLHMRSPHVVCPTGTSLCGLWPPASFYKSLVDVFARCSYPSRIVFTSPRDRRHRSHRALSSCSNILDSDQGVSCSFSPAPRCCSRGLRSARRSSSGMQKGRPAAEQRMKGPWKVRGVFAA